MRTIRRGVYPGSFNPPTVAHLAIADAARHHLVLDEVVLTVSEVTLGKDRVAVPRFEHRIEVLEAETVDRPWLSVAVTGHQLIADIAGGYDAVIMGADKWHQIHDVTFYDDETHRDRAVDALPDVVVIPRPPHPAPDHLTLELPDWVHAVSSTRARGGHRPDMSERARRFDERTGAWTEPGRYRRWAQTER